LYRIRRGGENYCRHGCRPCHTAIGICAPMIPSHPASPFPGAVYKVEKRGSPGGRVAIVCPSFPRPPTKCAGSVLWNLRVYEVGVFLACPREAGLLKNQQSRLRSEVRESKGL
jgi:hypothetical protein